MTLPKNISREEAYAQGVHDGATASFADTRKAIHEFRESLTQSLIESRQPLGPSMHVAYSTILDGVLKMIDKVEGNTNTIYVKYEQALQAMIAAQAIEKAANGSPRRRARKETSQENTRNEG